MFEPYKVKNTHDYISTEHTHAYKIILDTTYMECR